MVSTKTLSGTTAFNIYNNKSFYFCSNQCSLGEYMSRKTIDPKLLNVTYEQT